MYCVSYYQKRIKFIELGNSCFKRKLLTFQDKENKKADDLSQLCFDLIWDQLYA